MTTKFSDGTYQVNPFPEMGGRNTEIDVVAPIFASTDIYYRLDQLQKLPDGAKIPSVYNPPR
jgi:hypothetical protein